MVAYLVTPQIFNLSPEKCINVIPRRKCNALAYQAVQTVRPRCPLALNIQWKEYMPYLGKARLVTKGTYFSRSTLTKECAEAKKNK